jgi:hypothetical protein
MEDLREIVTQNFSLDSFCPRQRCRGPDEPHGPFVAYLSLLIYTFLIIIIIIIIIDYEDYELENKYRG